MISISADKNVNHRKIQHEDSKKLFELMKNSNESSYLEFLKYYCQQYSTIAAERVLNYYLDACIEGFILENDLNENRPCIVKDFEIISTRFCERYHISDDRVNDLIFRRINWSFESLKLSNISKINSNILLNCKQKLLDQVVEEVSFIIKSPIRYDDFYSKAQIKEICAQLSSFADEEEISSTLNLSFLSQISKMMYLVLQSANEEIICDFIALLSNISIMRQEEIMNNIVESITHDLLNIGNSTSDIIWSLHGFIPKLRKIDPSCFVLDGCLKEVKRYFKTSRKDLGRALLQFLLENKESNFSMKDFEDQKSKAISFLLDYPPNSDCCNWKPDPVYIKTHINPELRTFDPINLIISNLSSTPLAEEYQKDLAKKLLKIETVADIDRITEELEILRLKCGENFVTSAKIMVNDVIESKKRLSGKSGMLNVTIISHRYWPELTETPLEHPESILEDLELLKRVYTSEHSDKKIIWRPQMDEVKLELEFNSGIFTFSCPIEAAILMSSFEFPINVEEEVFNIKTLAAYTGITERKVLKSALSYWLKRKIIVPTNSVDFSFKFADDYDPKEPICVDSHLTIYEAKDVDKFADDEEGSNENFIIFQEKYWPIIANMFKTFGQISAERIQSTLKMYSKEYKETLEQLTKFLQSRVKEGILQSSGNRIVLYSILNK